VIVPPRKSAGAGDIESHLDLRYDKHIDKPIPDEHGAYLPVDGLSMMRSPCRHLLALLVFLACVISAQASATVTIYASPDGQDGYFEGARHRAQKLSDILATLDRHPKEDVVIQLTLAAPGVFTTYRWRSESHAQSAGASCAYEIGRFAGTPQARLIIRGVFENGRWLAQIRGPPLEETKRASCGQKIAGVAGIAMPAGLNDEPLDPLEYLSKVVRFGPGTDAEIQSIGVQDARINCFNVVRSAYVSFERLAFRDCWLPAILALDSDNISFSDSFIVGSSYVFVAIASAINGLRPSGYDVRNNVWVQDLPRYSGGDPGDPDDVGLMTECNERRSSELGKVCPPGAVWREVPWAVTHHGEWQPYNGALFGSRDIGGKVRFEENVVRNAYNGIRMDVSKECRDNDGCRGSVNDDVSVRDNVFAYVRDNPIEPERRATNWRVSRNRFFNSYAWFSLDGVNGGPFYVWANIGWHDANRDSLPGRDCIDGPQWLGGQWWDFAERDVAKNPKPVDWRDHDPFCNTHVTGTIVKLSWEKDSRISDFYMFNNSWMISMPIVRGGILCEMSHWNNAVEFTSCGSQGEDACGYRPLEPVIDEGIRPYPTADGKALFFDQFGLEYRDDEGEKKGCDGSTGPVRFDYDLSNDGFPPEFSESRSGFEAMDGFEKHGVSGSAGFRAPEAGGFTWDMGSPAQDSGCAIEWQGTGPGLTCGLVAGKRSSIGAMQWDGTQWSFATAP
jgi:hypothetical protein